MSWTRWIFSLMHWKYWAAIVVPLVIPTCAWWAPGADATTTSGILLGLWYIFQFFFGIYLMFWLLFGSKKRWDHRLKIFREILGELKDFVTKRLDFLGGWWNSRPGSKKQDPR